MKPEDKIKDMLLGKSCYKCQHITQEANFENVCFCVHPDSPIFGIRQDCVCELFERRKENETKGRE